MPVGEVATSPQEAQAAAERLGTPVVVKAQVLTGGRGKAGGVKLAKSAPEAASHAKAILGMDIKGHTVRQVLLDPAADIRQELYFSFTNDRAARRPLMMASAAGGMDIEEVNRSSPEKIIRVHVDPLLGLRSFQITRAAVALGLDPALWRQFGGIAANLYRCFRESDATLCEVNPLAVVAVEGEQKLVALDGKMSLDENALFRRQELEKLRDSSADPAEEVEAREAGINYVKLDGQIGCMVNGAGLAMATMDLVGQFGESKGIGPANFLDVSGGANAAQVAAGLRIILSDSNVKAVLINIFGGITRGDEVARGILAALEQVPTQIPLVVRLAGTNHEEGLAIIRDSKLTNVTGAASFQEAARKAVESLS